MEPDEGFKVTDRRRREAADVSPPPSSAFSQRSLLSLFMMLARSAVVAMGAAPDPVTGETRRDLDQAADAIDMLMLLRDKTEGNRTIEETRVLDQILYDLQLGFVSAKKTG